MAAAVLVANFSGDTPAGKWVMMGKKIKGGKRLLVVASQGYLLCVRVVSAALHDGTAALKWRQQEGKKTPLLKEVVRIYGDTRWRPVQKRGRKNKNIKVTTTHDQIGVTKDGMKLHKRRWVVEKTFAWELCSRKLARDFKRKPEHAEAVCYTSFLSRILQNFY